MASKAAVLAVAEDMLTRLPDAYVCVACGRQLAIAWEVIDAQDDYQDYALRIQPANRLDGWCNFGGSRPTDGKDGLHCPECTKARRSAS